MITLKDLPSTNLIHVNKFYPRELRWGQFLLMYDTIRSTDKFKLEQNNALR
eukprot:TRINITY_DN476_c0_g1_i1.p1 TRINITY_DN476_c0_g1~~TRINITY_DN476_c0_g1_i1.p1  ORF type:complete len:51 (-),score=5.66 TRINITY_DN476_c0_g1_i1:336-488(-)